MPITLVVGGCRSGKSSHALKLAEATTGLSRIFLATCVPLDNEMEDRVAKHKQERSSLWKAIDTPVDLSGAVAREHAGADVILIDCLTLWASNLMAEGRDTEAETEFLIRSLKGSTCPVYLVSNEVGQGIVPENELARAFRDAVGRINQLIASAADQVIWMVAGIPVVVKREGAC
jgi:adenosylcobinamide kinase/adenosylcobinamide-phosphate guanylyltransferase